METLIQYLYRTGLLENGTKEEIEEAKKTFRKAYSQNKQREYRRQNIRKEIILTKKEFSVLCKAAEQRKIKLSPFLKKAALCYVNEHFILPEDSRVNGLELNLRRIGNNINQLIRYAHQKKGISVKDIQALQQQINKLEDEISRALRQPISLRKYLEQLLQDQPEFVAVLEQLITKYKKENDHNNKHL